MVPVSQEDTIDDAEVRLAACALLIEIAHADEDFTEDERQHLASAIRRQYGLDGEQVEELITGRDRNDETAELAGALAVRGAEPLNFNHFKVPLMENLVKRAVRDAVA